MSSSFNCNFIKDIEAIATNQIRTDKACELR